MPPYNFKKQFAAKVESGEKRQTFRVNGKRPHPKPGDTLYHYIGMRTKQCRRLRVAQCRSVEPTTLDILETPHGNVMEVFVNGARVDREAYAKADGFSSAEEMQRFFEHAHGFPACGVTIKW